MVRGRGRGRGKGQRPYIGRVERVGYMACIGIASFGGIQSKPFHVLHVNTGETDGAQLPFHAKVWSRAISDRINEDTPRKGSSVFPKLLVEVYPFASI